MNDKSLIVAQSLINYGITKYDKFLFFSLNTLEYAIAQIALSYLGITFCPSTPLNKVFELTTIIEDFGATMIFTSVDNAKVVKEYFSNRMDLYNERVQKNLYSAIQRYIGDCDEQKKIDNFYNLMTRIIATPIANIFIGEVILRDFFYLFIYFFYFFFFKKFLNF